MTIQVQPSPSGRIVVVRLIGDHDISTAPEVRRALHELPPTPLIVLDLAGTTFIDSTILGVFVAAWKRVSSRGGRITAINATGPVAKVLSITKLDDVLILPGTADGQIDAELQELVNPSEVS